MTTKKTTTEGTEISTKKFKNSDLIPCRSLVSGGLYITGYKTKIPYSWADYGDVQDVEYQDLIHMVRTRQDRSIYTPRIIIEDDDFVEQNNQLKEFYDSLYTTKDLREIVELPLEKMKNVVKKLPSGAQNSLKSIVSTMIDEHRLDSVQKIKALDEIFGTQMFLTLVEE